MLAVEIKKNKAPKLCSPSLHAFAQPKGEIRVFYIQVNDRAAKISSKSSIFWQLSLECI
jgi:hypothetical protein